MAYLNQQLLAVILSLLFAVSLSAEASTPAIPESCDETDATLSFWRSVREMATEIESRGLVIPLAECLASPNPELRDRIAYEVLTYWMRNGRMEDRQVSQLRIKLVPWLKSGLGQAEGSDAFKRAFSALMLSEVLRYDALQNSMAGEEVYEIHKAAVEMFVAEQDYRGLTVEYGWIHTIAHGADLLWRLALHPLTNLERQAELLQALSIQIVGQGKPAYTFNEPDRLARVVVALARRAELTPERITAWIHQISAPGELESWNNAFTSREGMAQLHNQKQFLRALREKMTTLEDQGLMRAVEQTLSKIP